MDTATINRTISSEAKVNKLAGDKAKYLFYNGKSAWNQWVKENPEGLIDLRNITFTPCDNETISFVDYMFPNTFVDFTEAIFDVSIVDFSEVVFPGGVCFNRTVFKSFRVLFYNTRFDGNKISHTSFVKTDFSDCIVSFNKSIFVDEIVFHDIKSKSGQINFYEADFKQCNLFFTDNRIESPIVFNKAEFGCGRYLFEECQFFEHVGFSNISNSTPSKGISFKNSSFHSSLDLSGNNISTVIDLTNTKITNQVSLSGLNCKLNRKYNSKAENPHDAVCFMRLKEIAASNNDHQAALDFHANEMRAKRWHYDLGAQAFWGTVGASIIDTFYDWASEYGQSISRPTLWLLLIVSIFTTKYAQLTQKISELSDVSNLAVFSLGNSLPLIPTSKLAREAKIEELFGSTPPELYDLMMLQGGLSFIFIFLIGLGLRNRFRI